MNCDDDDQRSYEMSILWKKKLDQKVFCFKRKKNVKITYAAQIHVCSYNNKCIWIYELGRCHRKE